MRRKTVTFPEVVAAQEVLSVFRVRSREHMYDAEAKVRREIADHMLANDIEPYGVVKIEWVCRGSVYGYRRPEGMSARLWRVLVSRHKSVDHFGKPAAIESEHDTEEPQ